MKKIYKCETGRAVAGSLKGKVDSFLKDLLEDVRQADASDDVKHRGAHLLLVSLSVKAHDLAMKHQRKTNASLEKMKQTVGLTDG